MANGKTPEESLHETLKLFDLYTTIPENIPLVQRIQSFIAERDLSDLEERLIPMGQGHFKSLASCRLLELTFEIAFHIHYFHNLPYKVVSYVKAVLLRYEISLRYLLKDLLILLVKSKRHFQFSSSGLDWIVVQLENLNVETLSSEIPKGLGAFEYFTGSDSIEFTSDFLTSTFSVKGLLSTKEEEFKKYFADNYSQELIQAIAETFDVNIEFNASQKPQYTPKLLNIDMLELKPNFMGVGVNFNEIFKVFSKKRGKKRH